MDGIEANMSIGYPLEDGWQRKQRHQFNSSKLRCLGKTSSSLALEKTVAYAKNRLQFGRPIGEYHLTQHKIGLMAMYLAAARHLTYGATRRMEHWQDKKLDTAMSKLLASDVVLWLTPEGQLIHGVWGYAEETPMSRYVVDALGLPIFEGVKSVL